MAKPIPEMPSSVFVALVGRPNVGKSSLTNYLVGEKVAIVTKKPQTTRSRITGVITKGPVQYVLMDTPGIHAARNKLDARMTQTAAASLSKAIQEGKLIKEYVALVHGNPPESGDWEDLLWKDSRKNKVFVVKRMRGGVKKARLEFTRLASGEESLVRVRLHTGRSHQIRVQFASRGYPLWGERKYSTRDDPCEIALFSQKIGFFHPKTGEWMEFRHEPP